MRKQARVAALSFSLTPVTGRSSHWRGDQHRRPATGLAFALPVAAVWQHGPACNGLHGATRDLKGCVSAVSLLAQTCVFQAPAVTACRSAFWASRDPRLPCLPELQINAALSQIVAAGGAERRKVG